MRTGKAQQKLEDQAAVHPDIGTHNKRSGKRGSGGRRVQEAAPPGNGMGALPQHCQQQHGARDQTFQRYGLQCQGRQSG